uniref:Uncharacterized protein n=1 Tax=Branchiostoma floridae TaxID=7739 RepID=C3YP25_BRAFL|eukprot:XP_002601904.1 hypothetical protein BRAFLDRAFT_86388 [Branchiostoma floridae]
MDQEKAEFSLRDSRTHTCEDRASWPCSRTYRRETLDLIWCTDYISASHNNQQSGAEASHWSHSGLVHTGAVPMETRTRLFPWKPEPACLHGDQDQTVSMETGTSLSPWRPGPDCFHGNQNQLVSMETRTRLSPWKPEPACLHGNQNQPDSKEVNEIKTK